LHAGIGKSQLFGGQGHARDVRAKFGGGCLSQCAPAAADFQHPVARFGMDHAQGAAHLGFLGIGHVLAVIAFKPGR
jgi:hypothetical protein